MSDDTTAAAGTALIPLGPVDTRTRFRATGKGFF